MDTHGIRAKARASMKPRSFERGKSDGVPNFLETENASMKPRSFERGKADLDLPWSMVS